MVALVLTWALWLKLRLADSLSTAAVLTQELRSAKTWAEQLQRRLSTLEREQKFVIRFMQEFPHLTRQLHSRIKSRDIPEILLGILQRTFESRRAIVLLRRRDDHPQAGSAARFVVAAIRAEGSDVELGAEVTSGRGDLGYVVETQRVTSRSDLTRETPITRLSATQESLPGFSFDLAAPMVFDEQSLGVVAVADLQESSPEAKSVIRLIAQMGAFALHNATALSRMKHTADVDGLTAIFNKRFLTQALGELVFDAEQKLTTLSIFLFDIDHFKSYNDRNGHVEGDQLLRLLAQLVRQNVRDEDVFGRFGGEEFLLLLPETNAQQALQVAEKIRAVIASHPFRFASEQPLGRVSISGGVASYPSHGLDSRVLLRAADAALYQAKSHGRDRVFIADSEFLDHEDPDISHLSLDDFES